jgi:hypothetical protein
MDSLIHKRHFISKVLSDNCKGDFNHEYFIVQLVNLCPSHEITESTVLSMLKIFCMHTFNVQYVEDFLLAQSYDFLSKNGLFNLAMLLHNNYVDKMRQKQHDDELLKQQHDELLKQQHDDDFKYYIIEMQTSDIFI